MEISVPELINSAMVYYGDLDRLDTATKFSITFTGKKINSKLSPSMYICAIIDKEVHNNHIQIMGLLWFLRPQREAFLTRSTSVLMRTIKGLIN